MRSGLGEQVTCYRDRVRTRSLFVLAVVAIAGCGHQASGGTSDAGVETHSDGGGVVDAGCPTGQARCGGTCIDVTGDDAHCGACDTTCAGAQHCAGGTCVDSKIQHVVLIVQENHTFDSYFGRYCQAPAGSNPTCTDGPSCCERAPDSEPQGAAPTVLDDSTNFANDRDHLQACELQEIDDGGMDKYVTGATGSDQCFGSGPACSSADNFALATADAVGTYWSLADQGALADRYFQPIVGGSSSNDMYFATAHYQFTDDEVMPDAIGCLLDCAADSVCLSAARTTYQGRTTVSDLLVDAGRTFKVYAEGYSDAVASGYGNCPGITSDCPYDALSHPVAHEACRYDASDIPFAYYAQLADGPSFVDLSQFADDAASGSLPSFAYLKALTTRNEHPNFSTISDGSTFVEGVVQTIAQSSAADSTLILVTWDEGGGFFDHVPPPPGIDTDDAGHVVPYGTRVPMLALGPFARAGAISHVNLEHSSVVRFLEFNFLGPVGQLGHNDAKVSNLGSLLDPTKTGVHVPE